MARKVYIPITDHNDGSTCTAKYSVRYRLTSGGGWTVLADQYGTLYGSPAAWVVEIDNLADDVEYEVGITRTCCAGTVSDEALITFTTTPT